jgi:hypothetical protein
MFTMFTSQILLGLQLSASLVLCATVTSDTRQSVNGFGASGAWWPKDVWEFPASAREETARLLFDPVSGIRLTDYRYNLGGGGVGVGTWARAPETPYVSDGVYNFSADPQGVYFLKQAARYRVPQLTLFVNSAVSLELLLRTIAYQPF